MMKKIINLKRVGIIISIIALIGISNIIVINNYIKTNNYKKIIKGMNDNEQIYSLNKSITDLNTAHTEYQNYITTCKTNLATAITNEGVTTSTDDTLETMIANIGNIFAERTKLEESIAATSDNISEGKKVYVNGHLITGTGKDNNSYYEEGYNKGKNEGKGYNVVNLGGAGTYDLTGYENYENFKINENIFIVTNKINVSASISTGASAGIVSGSGSNSGNPYSATYSNGILKVSNGSATASGTVRDSYEPVGSIYGSYSVSAISIYLIY